LFYHEDGFSLKPRVFTKTTAKLEDKNRRVPSTSTKDHLPYFFETCPFTYELSEYIKSARILGTNVKGFKKKYIVDSMVRPVYNMHIAVTGRTSSEDPNGQNFPKRGPIAMAYRKLFVAPPGYFVLEADLSQAELRIAGDMANDPVMIDIYRNRGDIHTATALIVMGTTMEKFRELDKKEQKDARTKAKAVNFGFLYGMGWRKFIAYAKTQYGVEFSEKEAQRIRVQFFQKYTHLSDWHKKMRAFAQTHKFIRSYSGRVRHLPMIDSQDEGVRSEAQRQAINSPVQEFGSSLGVMACGRLNEEVDPQYLSLVGFVHDAIYAYVPKQYLEWGAKTLRWYMESNPLEEWFNRKMRIPIVAEVGFGVNLSEIFEMGDFDIGEGGEVEVGSYDFTKLFSEDPSKALEVPRQRIPPNSGRLVNGLYTHSVD
jgi:DNA polymerase I-like protein with 3'-5' exonuclease and polymerase domains